jgi:hypothetical protein
MSGVPRSPSRKREGLSAPGTLRLVASSSMIMAILEKKTIQRMTAKRIHIRVTMRKQMPRRRKRTTRRWRKISQVL